MVALRELKCCINIVASSLKLVYLLPDLIHDQLLPAVMPKAGVQLLDVAYHSPTTDEPSGHRRPAIAYRRPPQFRDHDHPTVMY